MHHEPPARGLVICLAGPDGSGKSTLARLLAKTLESRGYRVTIAWMRGTHTLASLVARLLSRFEALRGDCNPYYGICIPRGSEKLWAYLELASIIPVVASRIVLPRIRGRIVIAERSLVDFLAWLVLTLRDESLLGSLAARIILASALRLCDRLVYIRADEHILLERRRGSSEEKIIPAELRIYDKLAEALGVGFIDTGRSSIDECLAQLQGIVGLDGGER